MGVDFKVVIPARLGSTRLPRKVLREVAGKPVIRHVWDAAQKSGAAQILIATDSDEVLQACKSFGAEARMTAASHNSGTDRVNEIAQILRWQGDDIVVNVQGDEPLMPPALIRQCARLLSLDPQAHLATLCHPLHALEDWLNPNVVKLVKDSRDYALYFSRAPIPWQRPSTSSGQAQPTVENFPRGLAYRHIGLYAYRVAALRQFSVLPAAELENCEALEQLRALAAGLRIKVGVTHTPPPRGVDTEEDLAAVAGLMARAGGAPVLR